LLFSEEFLEGPREDAMTPPEAPVPAEVLAELIESAGVADTVPIWPGPSWEALRLAGILSWSVPRAYGGQERGPVELLHAHGQLATACLTTAFILSQREAAIRRIVDSPNEELRRELLPPLARDERFTTVGLSQLTTSRRYGPASLRGRLRGEQFVLDGVIPWVTGAAEADFFIVGAELEDGRQVLLVLPRDLKGVKIGPPLPLMALEGSLTAEITCSGTVVAPRWVLAGPTAQVMSSFGRGGTGGLETSCLALGLTGAATEHLERESAARPELRPLYERLEKPRRNLQEEMYAFARGGATPEQAAALRGKANTLVLQATQTALTASKGSGFLRSHPAQRWARQALFFLVWSCPRPATEATLAYLTPGSEHVCS
jgi:alkylation response protein AidB-like acyl-CoA dehydrogenase